MRRRAVVAALVVGLPAAVPATAALASAPGGLVCPMGAGTCSAGPTVAGRPPTAGNLPCQVEQFPAGGSPRNSASVPYEIPFTATLGPAQDPVIYAPGSSAGTYPATPQGGWLAIEGTSTLLSGAKVTITLGGPVVAGKGQIYAAGCGRVQLPSEVGGLGADTYTPTGTGGQVNPNFTFDPATPVSLSVAVPGFPAPSPITAYGSADGFLSSDILLQPAANGGLNVDFYSTAKSTSELAGILKTLSTQLPAVFGQLGASATAGNDCTVTIGDRALAGQTVPAGGIDGLSYADATDPVHLSTIGSVPDPVTSLPDSGQPVTGPIAPNPSTGLAQDQAVLVSGNFAVGQITPWNGPGDTNPADIPPSPNFDPAAPTSPTCSAGNATLLNELLGLPNPAGHNFFYAPGSFGVFTSS